MRSSSLKPLVTTGIGAIILTLMLACSRGPQASSARDFYQGKTITWIVSSTPGSGTDLLSRVVAPYVARETGAQIKIENADNEVGVNKAWTEGKPDGLTFVAHSATSFITSDILKSPGIIYETEKLSFLADVNPSIRLMQNSPKLSYKTLDELRKARGLKGGATIAKGIFAASAAFTLEILGLDGQVITGYKGSKDLQLAVSRGEVDFMVTTDGGATKDEADGFVVNFVTIADRRSEVARNLPTLAEMGVKIPKELESVYQYISNGGTAVATTQNVPQDRVTYLRDVFRKINGDKALQKEMVTANDIWRDFVPGEKVQEQMAAMKANKKLAEQIDAIYIKYSATR